MSLFVMASLLSVLVSQAQGASVQACPASIQQCISEASMKVREQFPDAQLYQVSLFALQPDSLKRSLRAESVQGYFYIGKSDRYVKSVQRLRQDGKSPEVQISEESATPNACTNAFPSPDASVCAQQNESLKTTPIPLDQAALSSERIFDLLA